MSGAVGRAAGAVAALVSGAGLSAALGLLAQVLIARGFDAVVLGAFTLCVTVASTITPLALGGVHWFEHDRRVIDTPAAWRPVIDCMFHACLALGVVVAASVAGVLSGSTVLALVTVAMLLGMVAVERALAYLQVQGRFQAASALQTAVYVARVGAVLLAWPFVGAGWLWAWLVALHGVLAVSLQRQHAFLSIRRLDTCRASHFRRGWHELAPLMGIATVGTLAALLDRLVVSAMFDLEDLGHYGIAASALLLLELAPRVAAQRYLMPRLGTHVAHWAPRRRLAVTWIAAASAFVGGLALAALASALAAPLVVAVFGAGFAPAGELLALLAWALPGRYLRIATEPFYLNPSLKRMRLLVDVVGVVLTACALAGAGGAAGLSALVTARIAMETLIGTTFVTLLWLNRRLL